jgi:Zn-dependent protease
MQTGEAVWIGLASLSALLNVLNLIPVWVLDGAQAIAALNKTERIVLSATAVLLAALFGQPTFLLVAGGAGYRAFDKNIPAAASHGASVYYVLLLAALGYLTTLAPLVHPAATG